MADRPDFAALFTAGQARVVALTGALGPDDLARRVPATPEWSVRDLLGHLAAVSAGALDGDVHPESAEWTAAGVREREHLSAEQVLAEWLRLGPRVEEMLRSAPPRAAAPLVVDLVVHEQDLRGAVGEPPLDDPVALTTAADTLARGLRAKARDAGAPPLRLEADGWSLDTGDGEPAATWRAGAFELTRALSGRRSAAQVEASGWEGDASPYLPLLPVIGRLRDTDLVE